MGKRQRRRERTSRNPKQQSAIPPTPQQPQHNDSITYEVDRVPVLRVEFRDGISPDNRTTCSRYWAVDSAGAWKEHTTAIGAGRDAQAMTHFLNRHSTAFLLTEPCVECKKPLVARNRAAVIKLAGNKFARHRRATTWHTCPSCEENAKGQASREVQNAVNDFFAQQQVGAQAAPKTLITLPVFEDDAFEPEGSVFAADGDAAIRTTKNLVVAAALALYASSARSTYVPALTTIASTDGAPWGGRGAWGDLSTNGYLGWFGTTNDDLEALSALHRAGFISPHRSTPGQAFYLDNGRLSIPVDLAVWQLTLSLDDSLMLIDSDLRLLGNAMVSYCDRSLDHPLHYVLVELEAKTVIAYINHLLVNRYLYPQVPHVRLSELTALVERALHEYEYTRGQLVAFAWRAVDTVAAWKERNHLDPRQASSAVVTTLANKIEAARSKQQHIPEYDLPSWHIDPPALEAAHRMAALLWPKRYPTNETSAHGRQ
ncbi:hypothetical protein [Streptomyces sp. CS014]|uniref:hypothetical protein n=1 Tax=Streptomyces sp. CS014 TaxID=2162707 RepID=UPI000D51750E|nr:hypothetical protein [Streptomyces sp. CS014]PVD04425.1 hypothetical protein DBP12_03095 [Streptomyces sp. CS014]